MKKYVMQLVAAAIAAAIVFGLLAVSGVAATNMSLALALSVIVCATVSLLLCAENSLREMKN